MNDAQSRSPTEDFGKEIAHPTAELKFIDGVLHQKFHVQVNDWHNPKAWTEWRAVPSEVSDNTQRKD